MTTAVQRRRGTNTEHASFTGLDGEITVNTTTYTIHVHDGTTVGGIVLAKADGSNLVTSSIDIDGGTIDGTVIGGSSAAAGSFTTISASGQIAANGGIALGDNDKATFGAGSDLQIYHDGLNSYMGDFGTGDLYLRASTNLYIGNSAGSASFITATDGGAVDLRYNGSTKLATTATGIDVTGTVTADGLTVDGDSITANAQDAITIEHTGTTGIISSDRTGGNYGLLQFKTTDGTAPKLRQEINYNGDISFYDDTGTTPKFFWDASAESLGIGTTSPASKLDVRGGNLYVDGGGISGSAQVLASFSASSGANFGQISNTGTRWSLGYGGTLSTVGTEVLSWNSSGNVGIGTTSPAAKLEIGGAGEGIILASPDGTRYKITVANGGILIVTAV